MKTAIEILEKHGVNTEAIELDAEYSFANILRAMEEYANLKSVPKATDIYDMRLHDIIDLSKIEGLGYLPFRYIMRVAGGWIYANYDTDKDIYTDKLFVPFNNDMQ